MGLTESDFDQQDSVKRTTLDLARSGGVSADGGLFSRGSATGGARFDRVSSPGAFLAVLADAAADALQLLEEMSGQRPHEALWPLALWVYMNTTAARNASVVGEPWLGCPFFTMNTGAGELVTGTAGKQPRVSKRLM